MNISSLQESLIQLLNGGQAHVSVKQALEGVSPAARAAKPAAGIHSVWEELEHMRLAQQDILRFTLDPSWKSPDFPDGYWPQPGDVTDEAWAGSVRKFLSDLDEVVDLVKRSDFDLTAVIPHGEGRTYLRQILLIADHNAYHLGELVQARKLLGNWGK